MGNIVFLFLKLNLNSSEIVYTIAQLSRDMDTDFETLDSSARDLDRHHLMFLDATF